MTHAPDITQPHAKLSGTKPDAVAVCVFCSATDDLVRMTPTMHQCPRCSSRAFWSFVDGGALQKRARATSNISIAIAVANFALALSWFAIGYPAGAWITGITAVIVSLCVYRDWELRL